MVYLSSRTSIFVCVVALFFVHHETIVQACSYASNARVGPFLTSGGWVAYSGELLRTTDDENVFVTTLSVFDQAPEGDLGSETVLSENYIAIDVETGKGSKTPADPTVASLPEPLPDPTGSYELTWDGATVTLTSETKTTLQVELEFAPGYQLGESQDNEWVPHFVSESLEKLYVLYPTYIDCQSPNATDFPFPQVLE